ncbi:MAG: Hsp20/alpha crystallin family protein, partial [Candidatus Diapherotrites archaeon]|nr:Hsp20/alpha crystallin family protein [Candidatus Diapherotrites archaeon]
MKATEEIKKLAEFLPPETRQQIFSLLQKYYASEKQLADALGFDLSLIKIWQSEENISKEHFPEILSLALQECPSAKRIISNALKGLSFLCDELNIAEKEAQDKTSKFTEALDEESRTIVWYLTRKGHAKIGELSALIALNDSLTLNKINEVINPTAKKILGKPVLGFKQAGFAAGEKVLFSWWIDESMQLTSDKKEEIIEVSNEKEFLRVTIALPNFDEKDILVSIENNCLSLRGKNAETSFFKKIPLYCPVKIISSTPLLSVFSQIFFTGQYNGIFLKKLVSAF